jgi:hypothetical protein
LKVLFNLTCSQTSVDNKGWLIPAGGALSASREGSRQAPNPGRGYGGWGWRHEAFTQ